MLMTCCLQRSLLAAFMTACLPAQAQLTTDELPEKPSPAQLDAIQVQARNLLPHTNTPNAFGAGPWQETPASVQLLERQLLDTRQVRTLSELATSDAALGDSYAPVGYYQNIAIRGFALDSATAYRFNGLSMTGEQRLALENVQQVALLKGDAGLAAGVIAPGGLVNYIGKRPDNLRHLQLGTDAKGTRHISADLGQWFTPRFGMRLNLANEATRTPVEHTAGHRQFYALATDWQIGPGSSLEVDINHHRSQQRSVSGYQLLGGNILPRDINRNRLPGYQPWQAPVTIASTNLTVQHAQELDNDWQSQISLANSRSVIDDHVAFAYGCFHSRACADGAAPGNFFAPDGDYDIYDYRSPDDTRHNRQLRAELRGPAQTGVIHHQLSIGVDYFNRQVDKRDDVYDYVGTGNIHQPQPPVFAPSPAQPGKSTRRLDSTQHTVFVMDRLQLAPRWQWLVGGRQVQLREHSADAEGNPQRYTRLSRFLPQTALLWQPDNTTSLYVSHAQGLSLGQEAPYWASNAGSILAPRLSRQYELGSKHVLDSGLALSAALFRTQLPYQYAKPDDSLSGYTFIQAGRQVHGGLELTASGPLGHHLQLHASASIIQARVQDTGTPAYEGHNLVNVPSHRLSLLADYRLPRAKDTTISVGWRHAAANPATADGQVRVPAWHVVDAGLRWQQHTGDQLLHWQLSVDNVFNRFYWRDTGSSYGDHFLFAGAPRQARLSVRIEL